MKKMALLVVLVAVAITLSAPVAQAFLGPNECDMAESYGWTNVAWNNACYMAIALDWGATISLSAGRGVLAVVSNRRPNSYSLVCLVRILPDVEGERQSSDGVVRE